MHARLRGEENAPTSLSLTIHRISPEGESAGQVAVSESLSLDAIPEQIQTAFSQGLVVLLANQSLFAIRPTGGQVVYKGQTRLIRDGKPWEHGKAVALSIEERRQELKERITALAGKLDKQQAAVLTARLDYLSRCIAGNFADNPVSREPEIHAVGMYGTGDANAKADFPVTVSHAAAPLILVLSAHEATTWRLKIGPKVRIEQIVLGGFYDHRVEGAPAGTPIIKRNQLESPQHYLFAAPGPLGGNAREGFASLAHSVFGLEPMTFLYESNKSSCEIGPGDEKWRASYLDSLARTLERDVLIAESKDLEFSALFRRGRGDDERSSLTTFSWSGPKQVPGHPLSKPFVLVTATDNSEEQFVVDRTNEIHSLQNEKLAPLASPEKDVSGRTTAIVWDASGNRMLAWHSRESRGKNSVSQLGHALIAFDLQKRAWQQIGSPGADIAAVAIDEKREILYGLVLPSFSNAIRELVVMNPHGAALGAVALSQPVYWDLDAGPPQAVFARGHLIVITPPQSTLLPDDKERLVSQIIAINPATGQTFFTGRYFCD
jgi:hypothetical protein